MDATISAGTLLSSDTLLIGMGSNRIINSATVPPVPLDVTTYPDFSFHPTRPLTLTQLDASLQNYTVTVVGGAGDFAIFSVRALVETAPNSNLFVPTAASADFIFIASGGPSTISLSSGVVAAGILPLYRILLIAQWTGVTSGVTTASINFTGISAGLQYV